MDDFESVLCDETICGFELILSDGVRWDNGWFWLDILLATLDCWLFLLGSDVKHVIINWFHLRKADGMAGVFGSDRWEQEFFQLID